MKYLLYILILTTLSCNNQEKKTEKTININSLDQVSTTHKSKNSEYYTLKDTVLITTERNDTLRFSKNEYNRIIDKHPEFFQEYPENPDQLYYNGNDSEEFASEAGQDTYYTLYAYFLKQRNGVKEFAQERQKLIDIYSNINSLFGHFEYGGTYFGHQYRRILGYAEYSIYLLAKTQNNISKTYDISKQKKLYMNSLRQLIDDESTIDQNYLGNEDERIKRTKKLNKIVDELDTLITDNFYLRRAQEFHYGHYEYH